MAKLTDHKGHRYLLEAMPMILAKHPNVVWALACDGAMWDEIQQRAIELGVAKNVLMLGHRKDVPDLLAAADLFAIPSHMEGLCSSIIDAMFAELPVVATTAGGIPDLLSAVGDEPATGWLVPPRDHVELGKAICSALDFPHVTRDHAARGRRRAEECFSADHMVDRTLKLFHEAIQTSHAHVA